MTKKIATQVDLERIFSAQAVLQEYDIDTSSVSMWLTQNLPETDENGNPWDDEG